MSVGRFYLRQGHLLAAINRFRIVVEEYQTTSHVPEALHRLAEAYTAIGLDGEAVRVAAVLQHNYPGDEWYSDSYNLVEKGETAPQEDAEDGWFSRNWNAFFDPAATVGGGGGRAEELAKELAETRAAEDAELMERARSMERERGGGKTGAPEPPAIAPPGTPKG